MRSVQFSCRVFGFFSLLFSCLFSMSTIFSYYMSWLFLSSTSYGCICHSARWLLRERKKHHVHRGGSLVPCTIDTEMLRIAAIMDACFRGKGHHYVLAQQNIFYSKYKSIKHLYSVASESIQNKIDSNYIQESVHSQRDK